MKSKAKRGSDTRIHTSIGAVDPGSSSNRHAHVSKLNLSFTEKQRRKLASDPRSFSDVSFVESD